MATQQPREIAFVTSHAGIRVKANGTLTLQDYDELSVMTAQAGESTTQERDEPT